MSLAETIPAVLADTYAEGSFVFAFVDRASARDAVAVPMHSAHQAVMLQNLKHGDLALDRAKVNEVGFGHDNTPFFKVLVGELSRKQKLRHSAEYGITNEKIGQIPERAVKRSLIY